MRADVFQRGKRDKKKKKKKKKKGKKEEHNLKIISHLTK